MNKARIKIVVLCGFIFVQVFTACTLTGYASTDNITRISIAVSDDVKYEAKWLDEPPRLVLKFDTPNVFSSLLKDSLINQGVVKNITVSYYPELTTTEGRKQIKFLTFWLTKKVDYNIAVTNKEISIDFQNPEPSALSRKISISSTINIKDADSNNAAIAELLAKYNAGSARPKPYKPNILDMAFTLWILLTVYYIMRFRSDEFKKIINKIVNFGNVLQPAVSSQHEKRKWWRHSLLPLKDKNLFVKIEAAQSKVNFGVSPKDIGYGGMKIECNRLNNLAGKLNVSIFLPGEIAPVKVEGQVAWKKNLLNIFKNEVGISFIKPPEKDWPRINNYIESQYFALNS